MRKSFKDSPALRFLVQVDDNTTENETKPYSIDAPENEPSDIQKKRRRHVKHEFTFEEEMAVGLSNICYSEPKAEVMTSRGDFHPRGLIGKLLYLRLWSASCTAKSFNE